MTAAREQGGFTLVEVMLALMVFTVAVVALVGAINGMGTASVESRTYREVQSRLESLLTEATRQPPDPSAAGNAAADRGVDKTVKEKGVEYRVKRVPLEIQNKDGQVLPELYTVTVTARWKQGGADEEMKAETVVHPPLYAPAP